MLPRNQGTSLPFRQQYTTSQTCVRKVLHQVGITLLGRTVHCSTYPINAELRNATMIRLPAEVVVVTSVESKKVLMVTSSGPGIGSERCVRFSRTSARVIEHAHQ